MDEKVWLSFSDVQDVFFKSSISYMFYPFLYQLHYFYSYCWYHQWSLNIIFSDKQFIVTYISRIGTVIMFYKLLLFSLLSDIFHCILVWCKSNMNCSDGQRALCANRLSNSNYTKNLHSDAYFTSIHCNENFLH